MSTKFVHVLSRIQEIDRDIQELKAVKAQLNTDRDYCYPVSISIELQMNNLVNERVKLMEAPMGDTPPGLHEDKRQFEKFLRARQGEFNVESAEEKFQNREASAKTTTDIPRIIASASPESKPAVGITKNMRNSLLGKDEDKPEKPAPTTKLSRAELLKNLPPAEY